jgi:NAD(P)H-dependent FMN reductase
MLPPPRTRCPLPYIPVLLGTIREGRRSLPVALAAVDAVRARGATSDLLDLADPAIPMLVERRRRLDPPHPAVEALGRALDGADALIVVTPEYNHGIPGALKNAVDHFLPEFARKPVGVVTVSAGPGGGRVALLQARALFSAVGAVPVPAACLVARVNDLIDADDRLSDTATLGHLGKLVDDVLWWEHAARLKRDLGA